MAKKIDLQNYRMMSEPHASKEDANKALESFFEAVEAARKEFRIPDVHVIVKMNFLHEETEGSAMASAHFGNSLEAGIMCAWALGQEESDMRATIREYLKGG